MIEGVGLWFDRQYYNADQDYLLGRHPDGGQRGFAACSRNRRPPIAFGLFAQGARSKTAFAVVPSGTITVGYDITDMWSLNLAYNYIYLSSVGRVGDQITSPADIRQSSFFAQGITLGAKAQF